MFRPNKLILTSLTVFMIATLTACNLGQAAEPTPTEFNLDAITTNVAATVQAQLTFSAPTVAPTFTLTLRPSETLAGAATNTQGVLVEATSAVTPSETPLLNIAGTPSLTPANGATSAIPSFTPFLSGDATSVPVCKNSAFDGDITIPDHTEMAPWEKFTKIWGVKNTGTCQWDEGFYFAATDGPPSMGVNQGAYKIKTPDRFVEPGETASIDIDMYAPGDPGEYTAVWHMFDDNGQPFGGNFIVVIKVVE